MDIKAFIIDVDGTLTNGMIYYGDNIELKIFNIKDGTALKYLSSINITVVFITGRISEAVARRAAEFNITAIQGVEDKKQKLEEFLADTSINAEQCAYIGDDLNDYAAMKICGFKACPSDAVAEIREICDYVSPYAGGNGAVRDVCEYILKRDGKYEKFVRSFFGVIN